jgi:GNAT superfamily N-acetyltransferase
MRPTTSIDFVPGATLLWSSNAALSDEIAKVLQTCFPVFVGLSTEDTLEEGIGFHALKDTTWLILRNQSNGDIIGMVTAVRYHDGLYLSNFSVVPEWRNKGIGLCILEAAGQLCIKLGTCRLIGNARADDRYIVEYYKSLGASVIQTGLEGGASSGDMGKWKFKSSSSTSSSSVRMIRDIPDTPAGVMEFFKTLRINRIRRRRGRKIGRIAFGVLLVTAASAGMVLLSKGDKDQTKNKVKS